MRGGIQLELEDVDILTFTPFLRRKQMAAYLTASGWDVEGAPDLVPLPARDPHKAAVEIEAGKTARTCVTIGLVFLLVALVLPLWQWRWIQSAMNGPVPISLNELSKLDDPASLENPWVKLRFERQRDSGVVGIDTGLVKTALRENRWKYVLIQVHDDWLIAALPQDHVGNEVVGYLDRWTTPYSRARIEEIQDRFPGVTFLPFEVDAHYPYRREAYSVFVLAAMFFLAGLLALWASIGARRRPAGRTA
jgi:hypothetical protein